MANQFFIMLLTVPGAMIDLLRQLLPEALALTMLFTLALVGSLAYSVIPEGTPSVNSTIELRRVSTPLAFRSLMCAFWSSIYAIESASAIPVPLFAVIAASWCGMSLAVPSQKVLLGPPVDARLILGFQAPAAAMGNPTTALPSKTTSPNSSVPSMNLSTRPVV